jgi:hypothetical protein
MAVTFFWKCTPYTHNVLVLWLPYVGVTPDEFWMTRLGEMDVWYKTIKVNWKMRLAIRWLPMSTAASLVVRLRRRCDYHGSGSGQARSSEPQALQHRP